MCPDLVLFNVFGMNFYVNIYHISAIPVDGQWLIVLPILQNMADYLVDPDKKHVHDLLNEKENYLIDKIMIVHKRSFIPDTFTQANSEGYIRCV